MIDRAGFLPFSLPPGDKVWLPAEAAVPPPRVEENPQVIGYPLPPLAVKPSPAPVTKSPFAPELPGKRN